VLGVVMRRLAFLLLAALAACDHSSSGPAPEPPAPKPAATPSERTAAGITYIETTTGGVDPETALPLVVGIHGYGANPDDLASTLRSLDVKVRLVLPRGIEKTRSGGFAWFPMRKNKTDLSAPGLDVAADRLAAAIDVITKTRPTRGRPIVLGFSQGGMLTFALALRNPELVAAAFPLSGWLPPELIPPKDPNKAYPKIIAMHGTADEVLPIQPTRDSVARMKERGFDVQLFEYPGVGHGVHETMRQRLDTLVGQAAIEQAHK
jgi:phospholipase/carboxylesterase